MENIISFTAEYDVKAKNLYIGSECGSGCEYKNVTPENLSDYLKFYIDNYVLVSEYGIECSNDEEHTAIQILVRDINGKRSTLSYENRNDLLKNCENDINDEDEILMVLVNNECLYNSLACQHPITVDDLTGFFG